MKSHLWANKDDSVVCFVNTYPLDSDLSSGLRYPAFEQPGPELFTTLEDTTLSLSAILCRGLVNYSNNNDIYPGSPLAFAVFSSIPELSCSARSRGLSASARSKQL